ncbi:MAG: DNA-processing protein DprA [Candidatus Moranbacteria bacterium]|nr:DNA-processing protein DprA [Candidatus Moranbacteria bacterium]
MNEQDKIFLNALNHTPSIGPQKIKRLLNAFTYPQEIWTTKNKELLEKTIGEKSTRELLQKRTTTNPGTLYEKLLKNEMALLTPSDEQYPKDLTQTPDHPPILYARGTHNPNTSPIIAVVGSRRHSHYGKNVTEQLSAQLATSGITIASGMALGIDAIAHITALKNNTPTIAVLANGLDDNSIAPQSHRTLAKNIAKTGLLLSEYPPETTAHPSHFPARNRIVAGISLGVLVVEAAQKSGSLITPRLANEYGREVFAIPGPITSPLSTGTNALIKNGAKMVTCIRDILEELLITQTRDEDTRKDNAEKITAQNSEEEEIIILIKNEIDPIHIDKIMARSRLETAKIAETIVMLEMKGILKDIGGKNYILHTTLKKH